MSAQLKPAVFLDRDGTIIEEKGYLDRTGAIVLYKSSVKALKRLREAGFSLVVVTNQSGVARGYFSLDVLHSINKKMKNMFLKSGIKLDGIYYCPHHPDDDCGCRKPEPGMIKRAAKELKIDLRRSYVIGDREHDVQLANKAGAKGILVLTGYGRRTFRKKLNIKPWAVCANLSAAANKILSNLQGTV